MQHYIGYPTNSSYLCGADAIGRRNTRTDTDATLTTCRACKASPDFPKADAGTPAPSAAHTDCPACLAYPYFPHVEAPAEATASR